MVDVQVTRNDRIGIMTDHKIRVAPKKDKMCMTVNEVWDVKRRPIDEDMRRIDVYDVFSQTTNIGFCIFEVWKLW